MLAPVHLRGRVGADQRAEDAEQQAFPHCSGRLAARPGGVDPRHTIFPGFRFAPGSTPSNSACSIRTPGAEMSASSQRACSVPTAWWWESVAPASMNACWIADLTASYCSSSSLPGAGLRPKVKYRHAPAWYECDRWHIT